MSFPFLLIFVTHSVIKNGLFKNNKDIVFNIFNPIALKYIREQTLSKTIPIKDIKEGNIVKKYYFNDEKIVDLINDVDGNLKIYRNHDEGCRYYFKSMSAGGITKTEENLLKIMSVQGIIGDKISIKISYPYTPAIFVGLLIAVFYGDIMMIFTKNIVLVM